MRQLAYIFREWFHTYIWTKETRGRTTYGFEMIVSSYSANRQMLNGEFEADEARIIKECLTKDTLFVDVGANLGFYSLLALKTGSRVISIEPKAANAKLLCENLFINNWTRGECLVHQVGLSERPGLLPLYGATGTAASILRGWAGHAERVKEIIPVTTLDSILQSIEDDQALFIKIDVEGAEFFVLEGALSTIKRKKATWLIEVCFDEYHSEGINPKFKETFNLFADNGYKILTADKNKNIVELDHINLWLTSKSKPIGTSNYLFVRDKS